MHTATFSQPPQRSQQRTRWAFAALASAWLLGCSNLGYSATLADVKLVDRNSGQRLTVYQHQGEYWVAGRPGASSSIDISNRIRRSVEAQLKAEGYDVKRSAQSYPFAALHGVKIEDGLATGGADPQRDGMAISVQASGG